MDFLHTLRVYDFKGGDIKQMPGTQSGQLPASNLWSDGAQECCIEREGSRDPEPLDSENRWGIGPEKEGLGRVFCLAFFFFFF